MAAASRALVTGAIQQSDFTENEQVDLQGILKQMQAANEKASSNLQRANVIFNDAKVKKTNRPTTLSCSSGSAWCCSSDRRQRGIIEAGLPSGCDASPPPAKCCAAMVSFSTRTDMNLNPGCKLEFSSESARRYSAAQLKLAGILKRCAGSFGKLDPAVEKRVKAMEKLTKRAEKFKKVSMDDLVRM